MKKSILIVCSLLLAAFLLILLFGKAKQEILSDSGGSRVWQHSLPSAERWTGPDTIPEDGMLDSTFASHLPLLVIDTDGAVITDVRRSDEVNEASHYGDNVNPYSEMTLSVFDSGAVNTLSDEPSSVLAGKIKIRGGVSDGKLQYRMKFLDAYGDGVKVPLLGMNEDDVWILNGMDKDETDLRSYIAYNLAGELNVSSPDVRFCEVLLKEADGYRYLGLYLLTEPVERGEGRVVLKGKRNLVGAYSYIVKRGKADSDSVVLSTWASERAGVSAFMGDVSSGESVLSLIYPKNEKVTTDAINYITSDISGIEQLLASDRIAVYASFAGVLDTESFIDYYILNEYMMNRGAGTTSTYMYRDIGGKLTMGPVWGFNGAASHSSDIGLFLMKDAPLYSDLFKNSTFDRNLLKRYSVLRETLLSDESIGRLVTEARDYLGSALKRDLSLRGTDMETNMAETSVLLDTLMQRGTWLDNNIGSLAEHTVTTYRYAIVSVFSIILFAALFTAATLLYEKRRAAGVSAVSGKGHV